MNEALTITSPDSFDADSVSMMGRIRRGPPAAAEDDCIDPIDDDIEAWARHASSANGFGDAVA
jgi:hypothetical protein